MICRAFAFALSIFCFIPTSSLLEAASVQTVAEAREAMAAGRPRQAVEMLESIVESAPSADAWLYLGIALANAGERDRALEVFSEGSRLYPADSRFYDETAGAHLADRNTALAVEALRSAIAVDPTDGYALDLLATIRLSEGDVQEALAVWNRIDQPAIDRISQNFAPGIVDREVPKALAFRPEEILKYPAWQTTQRRLFDSQLYSNVALDLEPSPRGQRFNAIVRTSPRRNTWGVFAANLARGLPIETVHFNYWDIARTGLSWNSSYRWDQDRRRLNGRLYLPLPLPGLPVLELRNVWRSENWNVEQPVRPVYLPEALFDYGSNAIGFEIGFMPLYLVELHGGFEYRNRDVSGTLPLPGMNGENSATINFGTVLRPLDRRLKNQTHIDGFVARQSLLGDFDFSGATASIINRFVVERSRQTYVNFALSAGTTSGNVPIDYYYMLGLDRDGLTYPLRGHVADDNGRYGHAPMGTGFLLLNTEVERTVATVPLFNTLNLPYVRAKVMGFFDLGTTHDSQDVFTEGIWYKDAGVGLRFETPTQVFTVLYGRDFTSHENAFYARVEPNLW